MTSLPRERWATRIGLVLALAGNAIGLGNFLRFPRQAAMNGGGAFLIPYLTCLLLIGIPLLWVELSIGRLGGRNGRGHTAGMFDLLWRHPIAKYIGALGIFIPFAVATYYTYVESWCLAYAVFALRGQYFGLGSVDAMGHFLHGYQGVEQNIHFDGLTWAYGFFALTLLANLWVLSGGVARGIEKLARVAMPLLIVLACVLAVRSLTLDPPAGAGSDQSVAAGLRFIWSPDLGPLTDPTVWLTAAGQILFTLSVGWGIVHCYASYMQPDEDIVTSGIQCAGLNEFVEVILGGTIALVAAVVFFGTAGAMRIAQSGSYDLGFQAMPLVLEQLALPRLFGAAWFSLLFLAGITSSVALLQPLIALLEENFGWPRRRAVAATGIALACAAQPVVLWLGHGYMDQLDFWAGSLGLVIFALVEVIVFGWIFGIDRGWSEINRGARLRIPRAYRTVIRWIMPGMLAAILVAWALERLPDEISLARVEAGDRVYVWLARSYLIALFAAICVLVRRAYREGSNPRSCTPSPHV